jgi:hypothetical protein
MYCNVILCEPAGGVETVHNKLRTIFHDKIGKCRI